MPWRNIVGDAANEPSVAVDPMRPNRIAIGWRQFDSIQSDDREAGVAWSRDCNRNGVDDAADLRRGASRDCNANAIPDGCELAAYPEADADRNGVLDECVAEPRRAGGRHAP